MNFSWGLVDDSKRDDRINWKGSCVIVTGFIAVAIINLCMQAKAKGTTYLSDVGTGTEEFILDEWVLHSCGGTDERIGEKDCEKVV